MSINKIMVFLFMIIIPFASFAQNERDYIRRGNRFMKDSLYSKAQVEYQKAIEIDNTNAIAHYNLGNSLVFQNKAEDAMKEYETASKFERNKLRLSQMYHNMGVLLQSAKQFDKAIVCYKNSLRNNPSSDETRYNYALCLYQIKKNGGNQDNNDQSQNEQDDKKEKDKNEQQKQNKNSEKEQEKNKEPEPNQMSKENAEQMLKAVMQDEKSTQEKMQKALQNPQQKRLQKQW